MSEPASAFVHDRGREHGAVVLSAIVGGGGSYQNLSFAAERLLPGHFTDASHAKLFEALCLYSALHNGVMSAEALDDTLRGAKAGTRAKYGELYAALAQSVPEAHQLSHAVMQLQLLAGERATGTALATAAAIMRDGTEVDGQQLKGPADARAYLLRALALAEQAAGSQDSPESNVAADGDDILAAYERIKEQRATGQLKAVQFGIQDLDDYLGGLPNGLILVVAPTSLGKSSLCVQAAWHNAVMLGLNVLFFTTEQSLIETRIKIVARHSAYLGMPLDVAKIRGGWLTFEEEQFLQAVVADLKTGDYGRIEIVQMPDTCTVEVMAARAEAKARWGVRPDVVFADYLQLFSPPRPSREARVHEDQAGIAKVAHHWGQTAFGAGVPLVSPWQPNEEGASALRTGASFSIDRNMSSSRESGRTASVVLTMGARGEDTSKGRRTELLLTVVKNRNGAANARFPVTADYAVSWFGGEPSDDGGGTPFPDFGDEPPF